VSLRITWNIDGVPVVSRSHTHPSHSQTSRLLTSSLSLGVPVPRTTQCIRGVYLPQFYLFVFHHTDTQLYVLPSQPSVFEELSFNFNSRNTVTDTQLYVVSVVLGSINPFSVSNRIVEHSRYSLSTPHKFMVFFHNRITVLTSSVSPTTCTVANSISSFTPEPTPHSRSSLSHTHKVICFFLNRIRGV
jgi:hypothetical protein